MKKLLIFFVLLFCALWIDLKPLNLKSMQSDEITVTVRGSVVRPGEVKLPMYATASQAWSEAGLAKTADTSTLNPNQILKDHDVITIPEEKSIEESPRVSINMADRDVLCTLPGIGPGTADKIIAYREDEGLFQNIEDLMNVKGIGQAKFEKLKDLISL